MIFTTLHILNNRLDSIPLVELTCMMEVDKMVISKDPHLDVIHVVMNVMCNDKSDM